MSASEKTKRLGAERQRLEAELKTVRADLAESIRDDARTGARQVDLVEASGWTREVVRLIVKGDDS